MAKKILVVEDEAPLSKALHDKLTREDFEVMVAKNGEEGLRMALDNHPDLIMLDILMPKMDGLQTLKELRKDAWGAKAEVILLTNFDSNEKVAEAIREHAFDYYVKSNHDISEIVSLVKDKLGEK